MGAFGISAKKNYSRLRLLSNNCPVVAMAPDLLKSARKHNIEEVIKLVENGADINSYNERKETALHRAVAL